MEAIVHPEIYKVVRVHWRDAATFVGWHNLEEISNIARERSPLMKTLGWLIFQSDEFILVAQSVGEKSAADICKIPSSYIEDMWIEDNHNIVNGKASDNVTCQ